MFIVHKVSSFIFFFIFRDVSGSAWLVKEKLELAMVEKIMDREYTNFINAMERLLSHPYAYRIKDFIEKYRKPLLQQLTSQLEIPPVQYDEKGRSFITTYGEWLKLDAESGGN